MVAVDRETEQTFWEANDYLVGRQLDERHWICVAQMLYTWRLMLCDPTSVFDFYCYPREDLTQALVAFAVWDGVSDPPGEWIRHHASGRRRVNGEIVVWS